jgi:hypothetical protein
MVPAKPESPAWFVSLIGWAIVVFMIRILSIMILQAVAKARIWRERYSYFKKAKEHHEWCTARLAVLRVTKTGRDRALINMLAREIDKAQAEVDWYLFLSEPSRWSRRDVLAWATDEEIERELHRRGRR